MSDTWLGTLPHMSLFCMTFRAYRLRKVPNAGGMDPVSLLFARYLQGKTGCFSCCLFA